ncbi:MAG: prolipoprotein diacylglyceryl transferase [Candidatus Methylomirabilales bacterium]
MYPVLLQIGSFELRSYGVFVAVAILVGGWLAAREAPRRGVEPARVWDFVFIATLAGIIGSRAYFVLVSEPAWFREHPWDIVAVWKGGMAIHGGLLAGLGAGVWFCRRHRIPFLRFADVAAPGLILGQTVGQVACLLNGDTYGRPTTLPWAITFSDPRSFAPLGVPLHPLQVYEGLAYLGVFALVWAFRDRLRRDGDLFLLYVVTYAIVRFPLEFLRGDPPVVAGVIVPQAWSVLALAAAAVVFVARRRTEAPLRGERR